MKKNTEDLSGQKFGRLILLKKLIIVGSKRKSKKYGEGFWKDTQIYYECKCECGNTTQVRVSSLFKKKYSTQSCGCLGKEKLNRLKKACGDLGGSYWSSLRLGAERRGRQFSITKEYAWDLFLKQSRLCALTGQLLTMNYTQKGRSTSTASLDRIDSTKDYIVGNVQWVHKNINSMKWTSTNEEFYNMCKLAHEHMKIKFGYD